MMKTILLMAACMVIGGCSQEEKSGNGSGSASVMHVYMVGNSLIRSITPTRLHLLMAEDGIDFQFGSQLKGGFSLRQHQEVIDKGEKIRNWESNRLVDGAYEPGMPDGDTLSKRFGTYYKALSEHKWDAVVLQPGFRQNPEKEIEAFRKFVNHAIKNKSARQIYVYTSWLARPILRDENGKRAGLGILDFEGVWEGRITQPDYGRRGPSFLKKDYHDFVEKMSAEFAGKFGKPIRMMPLGDVFCELDKRVKAGKMSGLEALQKRDPERIPFWDDKLKEKAGANIFYADAAHPVKVPHLDGTIGNYVYGLMFYAVLTGKSPVGLSAKAYKLDDEKDKALITALQTAVWDVVRNHPYTGIQKGK